MDRVSERTQRVRGLLPRVGRICKLSSFGNVKEEHWLGLKNISCLTGSKPVAQLRVDLADFEGRHKYARYSYFSVGNPNTDYKLSVGGYSGTAGDSLIAQHSRVYHS